MHAKSLDHRNGHDAGPASWPSPSIGESLAPRRALAVALGILGLDLWLVTSACPALYRTVLGVIGIALLVRLSNHRGRDLGLRAPSQPLTTWLGYTLLIAGIMAAAIGVFVGAAWILDREIIPPTISPENSSRVFLHMCILAPILEESIYRIVLCAPLAAAWGGGREASRRTIVVGGSIFAGLHVVYGNPAPDNLVAGFLLTWAYLRSGSIAVPLAWHALGNACAFGAQRYAWHLLH